MEELPQRNFVLLFRKLKEHPIYKKPHSCHYLTHCLISAWWNPNKNKQWDEGDEVIEIKRGQFYSTLKRCSEETGMSVQNIRTAQKNLVNHGFLTIRVTKHGRLITVCKYSLYQAKPREGVTTGVTEAQQTLNKHSNKENKDNNYFYKGNKKSFVQKPKKESLPTRDQFKVHPSGIKDLRAYRMLVKSYLNIKLNDSNHDEEIKRLHEKGITPQEAVKKIQHH